MHHTIRADDLALVLGAAKLRRHTAGATCAFAAVSAAPLLEVDCHVGRTPQPDLIRAALKEVRG